MAGRQKKLLRTSTAPSRSAVPLRSYLDTRAVIYMALGQPQKAIIDLEKVVETDPSPAELFHLAQAYLQANKQEKAKEDLQAAKDQRAAKRITCAGNAGL